MTDESPIHTVHKRVCQTFLRHWKAHNNAYPKLIKMTPEELRQFNIVNSLNRTGFRGGSTPERIES